MKEKIVNWIENEASDEQILELVECVNCWNGALEDYRYYRMEDLDELFCGVKPLEFLDKLASDFDSSKELFKDTIYGLESCDMIDAVTEIKENIDEIVDTVVDNIDNLDLPFSLENYLDVE